MTAQLATLIQNAVGPDFRIEQELDGGGMSRLFLATDVRHGRRVVVKVLSPDLVSEQSTARFKREIELTVRLQHPHILPILTSGAWEDALYYITPYIPGESLRQRIARDGKLPLDDVMRILREVSGALAFAHQRGIVHRDVKPGNILLAEGHAILADFGIARAVGTDATPITTTGVMPGTPAYMAPELPNDQAADVYALGLVGAEALIGRLPKRGFSVADLISERGEVAGDDRDTLVHVATLVARAASTSPGERISIADFAAQLGNPVKRRVRARVLVSGLAAAAILVAAGWMFASRAPSGAASIGNRIAVVPMPSDGSANDQSGLVLAKMREAFAEWREDSLVDDDRIAASMRRPGATVSDAVKIARGLGASGVVGTRLSRAGNGLAVELLAYSTRSSSPLPAISVPLSDKSDSAMTTAARRAVASLLGLPRELPWRDAADRRSVSLRAWRQYQDGRAAIAHWDLRRALAAFRGATATDADLAQPYLWLLQTHYWVLDAAMKEERRMAAARLAALRGQLSGRDTLHADGLGALSRSEFPGACAAFRSMIQSDSSDVTGWLGLGDCQTRDSRVMADAHSASGWSFRASFENAVRAYKHAGYVAPASMDPEFRGWLLAKLQGVLTMGVYRYGKAETIPAPFYAMPYLDADTFALTPWPVSAVATGKAEPRPAARDSASDRAQEVLQEIAAQWVRRAPSDPEPLIHLAELSENTDGVRVDGVQHSPLDLIQRAEKLADPATKRRIAIIETRLLLKSGDFAGAQRLASSILRDKSATDSTALAALATLTGRTSAAVQSMPSSAIDETVQAANSDPVPVPRPVARAGYDLLVSCSLGASTEEIRGAVNRIDAQIAAYVGDRSAAQTIRAALIRHAIALVYPERNEPYLRDLLAQTAGSPMLRERAQIALARGDSGTSRAELDSLRAQAAGALPSEYPVDAVFTRVQLLLAHGDTTAATGALDGLLNALPSLGKTSFGSVNQIGPLVRAMVTRAELARRAKDPQTAARWAAAVIALWKDADGSLQPVVARMRSISSH